MTFAGFAAMQIETGARLSEIVGLRVADLMVEAEVPCVHFRPSEELGRTLKTDASERRVPLVGVALWAAQEALRATRGPWLFMRHVNDGEIKGTHASNTINKWLRKTLGMHKTSHCFRHSLRDRFRAVGCPDLW
jgi:integrase